MGDTPLRLPAHLQQKMDQRQAALQTKKQKAPENGQPANDTAEAFWLEFQKLEEGITTRISTLGELPESARAKEVEEISQLRQQAEELLTDATRYLGLYDVKKAQNTLTALYESLEEKKTNLLPQKKFAFKARPRSMKAESSEQNASIQPGTTSSTTAPATNHSSFENSDAVVISDQSHTTIDKPANEMDGKDVVLRNLSGCKVFLPGRVGAVRADGLRECTVVVGVVEGSVLMHECSGCVFYLGCRQLRVHTTTSTDFYLDIHSHPIIEDCSGLKFGPLSAQPNPPQLEGAPVNQSDLWRRVNDFKWLRSDTPSPNWVIIPEGDRIPAPKAPIS